jgi:FixJ family two-component response regulator
MYFVAASSSSVVVERRQGEILSYGVGDLSPWLSGAEAEWGPIREVATSEELLESYAASPVGCVLVPSKLGDFDACSFHRAAAARRGVATTVVLADAIGPRDVLDGVAQGVFGFAIMPADGEKLPEMLRSAVAHDGVRRRMFEMRRHSLEQIGTLTAGEREVVRLLAQGEPNKRIARLLGVAMRTVENRRQRIMEKTKFSSLAELLRAMFYVELGTFAMDRV